MRTYIRGLARYVLLCCQSAISRARTGSYGGNKPLLDVLPSVASNKNTNSPTSPSGGGYLDHVSRTGAPHHNTTMSTKQESTTMRARTRALNLSADEIAHLVQSSSWDVLETRLERAGPQPLNITRKDVRASRPVVQPDHDADLRARGFTSYGDSLHVKRTGERLQLRIDRQYS